MECKESYIVSEVVSEDCAGMRIDAFLAFVQAYPSRSQATKGIDAGNVTVNGAVISKPSVPVCEGDVVDCAITITEAIDLIPQDIPLDIRYEDEHLLVISKQAGLVCHPSLGHETNTLVNALLYHCGENHLSTIQGGPQRAGIIHRLDADTGGLMICAKTDKAALALMDDIQARNVNRHYLALTHGIFRQNSGLINAPISRCPALRTKMAVRDIPQSKEAVTTFAVKSRFNASTNDNGYSLVDCKLFTGRTHQIRVHLEHIQHPVVGDALYTKNAPKKQCASLGLQRQFLHSYLLEFTHPETGEFLHFEDTLPADLQQALDGLQDRLIAE